MDNQPPIQLDYKSPDPPGSSGERKTSATVRFACGSALGSVILCVISGLTGGADIPIGPACGAVFNVAISAIGFFVANDVRGRFGSYPLRERNKLLTIVLGLVPIGVMCLPFLVSDFAQNQTRNWALVALALFVFSSACCNWIAIGREG